jgi:DNA ligase-4
LRHSCILEGELVVYSDKHHKILGFHKIRKHVSRSGSFLGTDKDSQAHPWEHLMIVYYDLLMIDNESLLAVKHSERFQRLKTVITPVPGRSSLVKRELIDCGRPSAVSDLRRAFAKCITARGEGLVLKADDPYFDFGTQWKPYRCCAIKLKKEYIGNFGDIGDFAVVGARFDAAKARTYSIPGLKWTHFYVGCLGNRDEVQRFGKQPVFVVTNVVELNAKQLAAFVSSVNPESIRPEENRAITLRIEPGVDCGKRPSFIFPTPPVFDLRCFSFDKEGNTGFWSPRFPTVSKIHCDRTYHDTISFEELQEMAANDRKSPPPEDSQELLGWIAALENSESRRTANTASQATISTIAGSVAQSSQPNPGSQQDPAGQNPTTGTMADFTRQTRSSHVGVQLTPATSTIAQALEPTASARTDDQSAATLGRKRPLELSTQSSLPERSKIQRRSSGQGAFAAPLPSIEGTGPSASQPAPSVGSQMSPSRRSTTALLPNLRPSLRAEATMPASSAPTHEANMGSRREEPRPSLQESISFHEGRMRSLAARSLSTLAGSSPVETQEAGPQLSQPPVAHATNQPDQPEQSANQAADNATVETASGRCQFLGADCKISTYSILVSPCVADFPWVTENLLGSQGVTEFLRDPSEWPNSSSTQAGSTNPNNTTAAATGTSSSASRRRPLKIIIVDRRRTQATVDFLRTVEAAGLKRRNGEREYVPVYDWHVLQEIYHTEKKIREARLVVGDVIREMLDPNHTWSMWKKFWVGLA